MIKARNLFLTPVIAILLTSWIPIIGIPITIIWIIFWYIRKQDEIHRYFKNEMYEKNEIRKEELDSLK